MPSGRPILLINNWIGKIILDLLQDRNQTIFVSFFKY